MKLRSTLLFAAASLSAAALAPVAASVLSVPAYAGSVNGITWTDSDDGTVRTFTGTATDYVKINGTGTNEGLNGATNVTKVIFNSVGGTGNAAWFTNATMSQAIELQGTGLVIKGGTNSGAAVFTGAITGGESSSFTWLGDSAAGNSQQFTFSGDLTGFSGAFVRTTASYSNATKTGAIFFGATTATTYSSSATAVDGVINNISGTGSITTSAGVVYNYTGGVNGETLSANNSSISAKTLTFGGGANYTVSSTLTGNNTTASNNTLTISAGTTTFTGAVSNFGNVTVASGATLAVGTGGELDLSGGNITLASTIQNSGTVTVNSSTTFDISIPALRSMKNADGSVSVISGGNISDWNTLTTDSFTFNGAEFAEGSLGRYSRFAVGSAGEITFTATAANLVWSNASGDGLWNTTSGNWTNGATTGDTFVSYDSVEFNTDAAVTVDSAGVTADLVTISAGTVSFTGGTITALGGVSVTGGTLSVGATNTALGTNTITLSGGTLAASAAGTLANAVNVTAASGINTQGNKLTLSGQITGTGTLTKQGTGTLFIKDRTTNAFHGTLIVESGVVMMGQDANGRSDSSLTDSA
ncbi:MAG: beta strand repeat-containing protein, partial [Candidatus Spyradosoma sp.]